ncbi:MAG: hypothetical protein QOD38_576 [Acidimicrobiaceae bacterium]|jgi:hypothetical protein
MFDAPALPAPRGPLSRGVITAMRGGDAALPQQALEHASVEDDDLHLALYLCYELHYRGWAGIDAAAEWDPALLGLRGDLERRFLHALHELSPRSTSVSPASVPAELRRVIAQADGPSLSAWAEKHATLSHLQELAIHRSPYQLKEADLHTWAIPRLPSGRAKSALLTLQFDEYGNGEAGATHAELFASTMRSLGLEDEYGRYLDLVPGVTLATVNLLSLFGLHRALVGACLGHLAVFEMTSVEPMTRYSRAHRRVTGADDGAEFYDVHVVADKQHSVIAIDELLPAVVDGDPRLAADVLFGARALLELEARFAAHVIDRWTRGRSSLHIGEELAAAS